MSDVNDDLLFPDEIASLLSSTVGTVTLPESPPASQYGSQPARGALYAQDLAEARPYEFVAFDPPSQAPTANEPESTGDTELELQIELGRAELSADERLSLRDGEIVTLDKRAEDPVDIVIDGRLIARGEVLVLNDRLCVRIAEILGTWRARGQ
ncbi:MAG: hypothetical protein EXS05_05680 [Planctomycetaceae bacterium]|nr:hypothetical protein [Planctomycetaceae bacterium]